MTAIPTGRIAAPGRQCEVVNGCFVAIEFVKPGFGEKAALGKADWRLRVDCVEKPDNPTGRLLAEEDFLSLAVF
jgi:histidinol-phosphate/aromatic aminotransferase/cobyric acid decarboxylase-like protein